MRRVLEMVSTLAVVAVIDRLNLVRGNVRDDIDVTCNQLRTASGTLWMTRQTTRSYDGAGSVKFLLRTSTIRSSCAHSARR